jgi:hypothetical protein
MVDDTNALVIVSDLAVGPLAVPAQLDDGGHAYVDVSTPMGHHACQRARMLLPGLGL